MAINVAAMAATIQAQLQSSGLFVSVVHHEPKSAPALGEGAVTAAFWNNQVRPASSGLSSVSVRVEYMLRLYHSALTEPADAIDPELLAVADKVMELLCGDFDMGGNARYLDVFGSDGEPLSMTSGYVTNENRIFRTIDITLPVIVNDAWVYAP